jgi:lipopolysaccharide export system permease protein
MKNNREIMAIKACGINIVSLAQTVITISLFTSIFAFVFSESVVPYTSSRSNEIWDIEVKKQNITRSYGVEWYKSSDANAIYWIKHFNNSGTVMEDPTFHFFNENFKLIRRVEAKKAVWQNGKWVAEDGLIQELQADGEYKTSRFVKRTLPVPETPEDFRKIKKQPEEMSYNELKAEAELQKNEGYNNSGYLVDMGVKIAFPFISLVLTLLGIPIALELKKGGIPLAVAVGMGLSFLYYTIFSISRSLGHTGVFPPFLAAWTANLLFIFAGIYLMMTLEQ